MFSRFGILKSKSANAYNYDPDASALFTQMSVQPDDARKLLYNDLIEALKDYSLWAKLDLLYIMAAHDAQAARLNVKAPSTFALTAVNTPTFTTDRGYAGNGSSSYLNTGFNPATAGGAFVLDSAHIGVWSRTEIAATVVDIGASIGTTNRVNLLPRSASDTMLGRINQDSSGAGVANTTSLGHFVASRTSSAGATFYKQGSLLGNGGGASTAIPSLPIYICGANNNGSLNAPSARQLAAAHVGSGFTAQNVTDMNAALQAWMTAVGA